jgi:spermidine/putrescine transport system ATP-binding protein
MRMPELLLLDEPFSALDRDRRERLISSLKEFCQVHKMGYVLVSHDERDVATLADEVWELRDGRLR